MRDDLFGVEVLILVSSEKDFESNADGKGLCEDFWTCGLLVLDFDFSCQTSFTLPSFAEQSEELSVVMLCCLQFPAVRCLDAERFPHTSSPPSQLLTS